VGADRIVNAVAATHKYKRSLIIIDFGTATTFSAVSEDGLFEGVAIAPGIITGTESLISHGAMLPQIDLHRPEKAIGKNTILSLQSGIIFGFAGLVEGLVARIQKELGGKAKVVATGGLARLICREVKCIDAVEPELTLEGVRIIYEKVMAEKSGE